MAKIPFRKSSGNIFADIGFSAAEAAELTVKSKLIEALGETIKRRKQTQREAARRCLTDQPTLSKVLRGSINGYGHAHETLCAAARFGGAVEARS